MSIDDPAVLSFLTKFMSAFAVLGFWASLMWVESVYINKIDEGDDDG